MSTSIFQLVSYSHFQLSSLHKGRIMFKSLFIAIVLPFALLASQLQAAPITWDNGGGGQLWSNNSNWNPDGPVAGNEVTFNGTAAALTQGTPTNVVDASVAINSLAYVNWNGTGTAPAGPPPASFHTTVIDSGFTLTVNGAFTVGTPDLSGTTTTIRGSSAGTGTLTVNNAGTNILVNPGGAWFTPAHTVTLDMSGLGNFNANVNVLRVGAGDSGATTMNLATTNMITANEVTAGVSGWGGGGTIRLGQTNTINTDLLRISGPSPQSGNGTINFNTGLTNPTVQFRAKDGVSRIATVDIGFASNNSGLSPGLLDLNAGSVNALFGAVRLGIGDTSTLNQNRTGSGTLQFNAGTIDATSILLAQAGVAALNGVTGTVTVGGTGTLVTDTLTMTDRLAGRASTAGATFNLNNTATLRATTIQRGAALGSGAATIAFNFNGGTISHKTGTDLTVDQNVPISILTSTAHNFDAAAARKITINSNVIGNGTGAVNKNGDGTLLMLGTNTYVAPTNVNAGIYGGTGSTFSDFTVAAGATLSPGASAGTLLTDDLTMQANSTLLIEIGGLNAGTDYDQVLASGTVNLNGSKLIVDLINGFAPNSSNTFTIIDAASVIGEFSSVQLLGGVGYFDVVYLADQVLLTNFQVPEPSTLSLVGMCLVGCQGLRRRRRKATIA